MISTAKLGLTKGKRSHNAKPIKPLRVIDMFDAMIRLGVIQKYL